jgi:YidC/Oxa1 family membrane protein insertase
MDKKNYVLAIILSIGFLFAWFTFVVPRFSPKTPLPSVPQSTENATIAKTASVPATMTAANPERTRSAASEDSYLRDPENNITLAPPGGSVRGWKLTLKGQEIDLVEHPDTMPLPLATFADTPFTITPRGRVATLVGAPAEGIQLTKTLALSDTGYLHTLMLRFQNSTNQPIEIKDWDLGWGPGLGTAAAEEKENAGLTRTISWGPYQTMHKLEAGEHAELGDWMGIDNRYFMVAFIPPAGHQGRVVVTGEKDQSKLVIRQTTVVPAKGETTLQFQLYAGPKGYTQLKKYGKRLEEGVDFGMFSGIGKLILSAIYALQSWSGNYGLAIVLLTIGLQILLIPLTLKSLKAQLGMRRLQPQIQALQAKHKGDPKRLNMEMLNLYKTSGTNPFGGCLPMLLQLPIFWALFTTLRNAYELRGAPFFGWIQDLSAADPYKVLPIIMGAAMFVQQKMTVNPSDPMQRQMMYIMPIMFTIMFMNFPSGLVLYWLTNNLVMLALQWYYFRNEPPIGKGTPDSPIVVKR